MVSAIPSAAFATAMPIGLVCLAHRRTCPALETAVRTGIATSRLECAFASSPSAAILALSLHVLTTAARMATATPPTGCARAISFMKAPIAELETSPALAIAAATACAIAPMENADASVLSSSPIVSLHYARITVALTAIATHLQVSARAIPTIRVSSATSRIIRAKTTVTATGRATARLASAVVLPRMADLHVPSLIVRTTVLTMVPAIFRPGCALATPIGQEHGATSPTLLARRTAAITAFAIVPRATAGATIHSLGLTANMPCAL